MNLVKRTVLRPDPSAPHILLSRRQAYIDQAIDYAAMSAKKNAPRWIKQLKLIGKWPAPRGAPTTASA